MAEPVEATEEASDNGADPAIEEENSSEDPASGEDVIFVEENSLAEDDPATDSGEEDNSDMEIELDTETDPVEAGNAQGGTLIEATHEPIEAEKAAEAAEAEEAAKAEEQPEQPGEGEDPALAGVEGVLQMLMAPMMLLGAGNGKEYDLADSGFNLTGSLLINGAAPTSDLVVKTGDTFSLQLNWRLPYNGNYTPEDTFVYGLPLDQFGVNADAGGDLKNRDTVIGTYSISDNKLMVQYNADFLALSDKTSNVWMSGTLSVNTETVPASGTYTINLPGLEDVVVKARTNTGITINKTAVKHVDNENHVTSVDYTITITSMAVNNDVVIRDFLLFTGEDSSNRHAIIKLSPVTATLNGSPYTLVKDTTGMQNPPGSLHQGYELETYHAYRYVVGAKVDHLETNDVLVITYTATYSERNVTYQDTTPYKDSQLGNTVSAESTECSPVSGNSETTIRNTWIRKSGKHGEGNQLQWMITVDRGEYNNLTVKETAPENQTIANDAVVTVYSATKVNSLDGATQIGTTTWAQLLAGYTLNWGEGDNAYRILVFETTADGTKTQYQNTASINVHNKSYTAYVSTGTHGTTDIEKNLLKVEQLPQYADLRNCHDNRHFWLRFTSELLLHIRDDAVELGSDFYFFEAPWNNQQQYQNQSPTAAAGTDATQQGHWFESITFYVKNATGGWDEVTDGRFVLTWEDHYPMYKSAGQWQTNNYLKTFPTWRFKDGNVIPGEYRAVVTSVYKSVSSGTDAIANRVTWSLLGGQRQSDQWFGTKYLYNPSKAAKTIQNDEIVWEISVPDLTYSFYLEGAKTASFLKSYREGTTIVETIPKGLEFVCAAWGNEDPKAGCEGYVTPTSITPITYDRTELVFDANYGQKLYIRTRYDGDYLKLRSTQEYENNIQLLLRTEKGSTDYANIWLMHSSAKAKIQPPEYVNKTRVYEEATAPYVYYTVKLNTGSLDMIPATDGNGDSVDQHYSMVDTMGDALSYVPGSILINDAPLPSTMTLTPAEGGHGFTLAGLEDGTAYTVTYQAIVSADTTKFTDENAKNTVTLPGIEIPNTNTTTTKLEGTVWNHGGGGDGLTSGFKIHKVDDQGTPQAVKGAVFTVYEFGLGLAPEGSGQEVCKLTTGDDGYTSFMNMQFGHIYGFKETTVPEGYAANGEDQMHYFVHRAQDQAGTYDKDIHVVGYDTDTYVYEATNHYIPPTGDLVVKKTITAGPATEFEFNIKLSDETVNGTYGTVDFKNGAATVTISGTKAGNTVTITGLPADVTYTVTESTKSGWSLTTSSGTNGKITGGGTVTASFTNAPDPVSVSVKKIWDDNDNQDGKRPVNLTVDLMNGSTKVDSVTLNEANKWTATVSNLPKYQNDTEITYTWVEESVTAYTAADPVTVDGVTTLKNSYTPETTSATVKKAWDDKDNQDGKRPGSLTVNLMNGSTKVDSVTLSDKNNWTDTISNLPKYANGREITYTWVEESVSGYTAADPVTENGVTTLKNTYNPGKVSVPVTKVWNDNNNQDNKRPTTIDVELLANNEATNKHLILSAANNWKGAFSDLDEYKNGTKITYTVKELTVTDYKSEITEDPQNAGGFIITNTHTPETTKVKVTKTWSDSNNQDGKRASVNATVQLYQTVDGTKTAVGDPVSVGSADNWSKTWENLPVNKGGKQITYSVEETLSANSSYTKSGDDTTLPAVKGDSGTIAITNSYTPETTKVTVTKTWNDSNNQDGKRSSVGATVQLYKTVGETKTAVGTAEPVGTADDWSKTWNDLPTHENGTEITYTVEETLPENSVYTSAISGSAAKGFTITNSYTPETVDVSVKKVWDDANNQDGKRPESLTVNLMNGSTKVDSVTLSDKNNWTDTIDNLPKYADGKEITYTWEEAKLPEGYSLTSSEKDLKDATLTVITNGYKPGTTSVTIKKIWDDENDQDGKRSGVVATVQLYKTVESIKAAVGDPVEVGTDNNWSKTWNDLPTHEGGKPISYSVAETLTTSNGYAIDGTAEVAIANGGTGTITNKNTPEVTSITVNKTWDDNSDQDGKRSGVVAKVTLKKTVGEATTDVETVTVGAADNWSKKWENLPVYEGGKKITYSVVETLETANGYTSDTTEAVTVANGGSKTIKNSYTPGETSITVTKKWDDKNNQDGKRSGVVAKVTLKKTVNGTTTDVETVTVGAADNWSKKWEKLPTHAGGKEITYSVVETLETANGYTSDTTEAVTVANGGSKVITNTYAPKETSIKVTKNWADSGNQDGKRPSNATVQLYKTVGETKTAVGAAITVGAEKDAWTYTWVSLPVYEDGSVITYSVEETLPDGTEYTKSGDDTTLQAKVTDSGTITITNSYTPETTKITVNKTWGDNSDQDGKRPADATVQLYKTVGETKTAVGDPVTVGSKENTWTNVWEKLPVYENGTKIVYSVEETLPEGASYTKKGDEVTLTAVKDDSGTIKITNTHEIEKTSVRGRKFWADEDDLDGIRPETITVNLLADGTKVDSVAVTPDEQGNWTYAFTNLDKYEPGKVGHKIEYSVTEDEIALVEGHPTGYTATYSEQGYDITNKHEPETIEIPVTKTWDDYENRYNTRPESITIRLLADGEEIDVVTLTAPAAAEVDEAGEVIAKPVAEDAAAEDGNTWTYTFTELPRYKKVEGEGSVEIEYSVTEDEVARYRTEIAAEPVFSEDGREEILVDITNTYRRPHKPTPPDEPIPPDDPDTPDEPIDDPDTPLTPPDGPNPPEPGFDEDEYLDDGDTPLSGYEEEEELDEEDVPLSPFTGDDRRTNAWAGVSLASLVGIAILARRRREEEE